MVSVCGIVCLLLSMLFVLNVSECGKKYLKEHLVF